MSNTMITTGTEKPCVGDILLITHGRGKGSKHKITNVDEACISIKKYWFYERLLDWICITTATLKWKILERYYDLIEK